MSHQEILKAIPEKINRVTVYRALDRLVEEHKIHKIIDMNGVAKYASCQDCTEENHVHHHLHFSCSSCNQVYCLDDVMPGFNLPSGYQVNEVNFTLGGTCPTCNKVA